MSKDSATPQIIIVDYKATSKDGEITLDDEWKDSYKRQMEIYQWIFRRMGFPVSNTGYFVYANGLKDRKDFSDRLEFKTILLLYEGSDGWIEDAIVRARKCLMNASFPDPDPDCEFCDYRLLVRKVE